MQNAVIVFSVQNAVIVFFSVQNAVMSELHTRVDELKMENEYQMRIKEMSYNDKIKELTDRFMQEVEAQKTKAQVYKTEKDQIVGKNEENQVEMMEKHQKEMQDIGTYINTPCRPPPPHTHIHKHTSIDLHTYTQENTLTTHNMRKTAYFDSLLS